MFIITLSADYIRDNDKNIIYDSSTKVIWSDNNDSKLIWSDALQYCDDLNISGLDDWYLPNFNQLFNLVDRTKYNPSIDDKFQHIQKDIYWSSTTTLKDDNGTVLTINFTDGQSDNEEDKNVTHYVRCIKGWD